MQKVFKCNPEEFLYNGDVINEFLSCFTETQRIHLASLCLIRNCRKQLDIKDKKRRKETIFNKLDKQIKVIESTLKSSYVESIIDED